MRNEESVTKDDVLRQLFEDICHCAHQHEVQYWKDCPGTPEERLAMILKHARNGLAVLSDKIAPCDVGNATK